MPRQQRMKTIIDVSCKNLRGDLDSISLALLEKL